MRFLIAIFLIIPLSVIAAERNHFDDKSQEADYQSLIHKVRCAVCFNEPIAESQATMAKDLRDSIADWLREGKTKADIETLLTQRYGDAILYEPPKNAQTLVLWIAPLCFVLLGGWVFWRQVR